MCAGLGGRGGEAYYSLGGRQHGLRENGLVMNQEAAEQCVAASKTAMAAGDWDKAIRLLDKSIRLNPDNAVRAPFRLAARCPGVPLIRSMGVAQAEAHVLKMKATSVRATQPSAPYPPLH